MSKVRKWPTVPQIIASASAIATWDNGLQGACYVDAETGRRVKVHAATLPNLLAAVRGANWEEDRAWNRSVFKRPTPAAARG